MAAGTGHGIRGEVVGWYMLVSVVGEKKQGGSGVRVVVRMRRVAVGRTAGSYKQAVGVRRRTEWCQHTIGGGSSCRSQVG